VAATQPNRNFELSKLAVDRESFCRRILIMRRCDLNDTDASNNASLCQAKLPKLLVGFLSPNTDGLR
jgi:hypothetical protein